MPDEKGVSPTVKAKIDTVKRETVDTAMVELALKIALDELQQTTTEDLIDYIIGRWSTIDYSLFKRISKAVSDRTTTRAV